MSIITCLEKCLEHLTNVAECMTNEQLQEEETAALLSEIQSMLDEIMQ
jgi:hypothetical protein